jgi:hypothetical protein
MEANSEGAGMGSFKREKITPATKPVERDFISNIGSKCIVFFSFFLPTYFTIIYHELLVKKIWYSIYMSLKKGILIDAGMIIVLGIIGYVYLTFFTQQPQQTQKTILPANATITDLAKPQAKQHEK